MRPRDKRSHRLLFTLAGALAGLFVWAYLTVARKTMEAPLAKAPAAPALAGPSEALLRARAEFRRRYLDPEAHIRLSRELLHAGRPEDSFLVLEAARVFFGDTRFFPAHAAVVQEGDRAGAAQAGAAWATGKAADFERQAREMARQADFQGALAMAEKGLATAPQDPGLLGFKALLLARALGRPSEALPIYRALAQADPSSPPGRTGVEFLGQMAQTSGPGAAPAIDALEQLYREKAGDPRVFQNLAMLRWAQGKQDEVRRMTEETLSKDPEHAGALSLAGALALQDKDVERALDLFARAVARDPDDVYALQKLAELREHVRRDRDGALALWIAVHHRDPRRVTDRRPLREVIPERLAARALAALKDASGPAALERAFASPDGAVRAQACLKAGAEADPLRASSLGALLDDDVELVRKSADEALYRLGKKEPEALRLAGRAWLSEASPMARGRALNLFADLFREKTLEPAMTALKDEDPAYRVLARLALDHYYKDDTRARTAVALYLAEESDPLAIEFYRGRGLLAAPAALPPKPQPKREEAPAAQTPARATPPVDRPRTPARADPTAALRRSGSRHLAAGRLEEAVADLEKADALRPDDPETLFQLARAQSRLRDSGKAAAALRRCLAAAQAGGRLPEYLDRARHDEPLSFFRRQPGFKVILKPFER